MPTRKKWPSHPRNLTRRLTDGYSVFLYGIILIGLTGATHNLWVLCAYPVIGIILARLADLRPIVGSLLQAIIWFPLACVLLIVGGPIIRDSETSLNFVDFLRGSRLHRQ